MVFEAFERGAWAGYFKPSICIVPGVLVEIRLARRQ
jgi:hypothetical protein